MLCQDLQSVRANVDGANKEKNRLTREFARIATGNSFLNIGNFASLSTKDETLSASLFFLTEGGNVINVEASGGATQGITKIFDEGKLNSKVSLGVSYNFMLRKANNAIMINSTAEDAILLAIENENRKYEKKLISVLNDSYVEELKKDIKTATALSKTLAKKSKDAAKKIRALRKSNAPNNSIQKVSDNKNAFDLKLQETNHLITTLQAKIQSVEVKKYNELVNALEHERETKVKELKDKLVNLKPDAISFSWISFGYKATNNSFSLFDESLELDKQILKDDYTSQSFFLSYSHQSNVRAVTRNGGIVSFKDKKREFISVGAKFDYTHNLNSLKQVEVVDTSIIDAENGRTKVVKQNAFSGEYEKDLSNLTAFFDYYNFIASKDILAIHMNPTMTFRENHKPVANFQFGLLLPFKDKDKQTTRVNLEIFYQVKDIFNTSDSTNALLNRNVIGLQTTFPFNL
ncbi:hypothetical protein BFR04_15395 [Gaetbulibacter sp. 4G1]|nr:hypothetical protein BFR04_15395 [Gaetbulibacter sp. 4G1]